MRNAGRLKLGYFPLPLTEADRLRAHLIFPEQQFAALDPCTGDGGAFQVLMHDSTALRYGLELDSYRAEQARKRDIAVIQGDTLDVECRVDSLSFLYLNPPYDFEVGSTNNQRMEAVFLRHTSRWLMPRGVLCFVIPQAQLAKCARTLAEHFEAIRVYRLTHPDCVKYDQVAVLAIRRARHRRLRDEELEAHSAQLERFSSQKELPLLSAAPEQRYQVPASEPAAFVYRGLPLDEIEDKLVESAAYRQVQRILLRERSEVCGRPVTPLHGGHVGLLCTAGMLNGVFGDGELRHVANWLSRKYTQTWREEDEAQNIRHISEYFSHECTILWANGTTQILTHEPPEAEEETDVSNTDDSNQSSRGASPHSNGFRRSNLTVMPAKGKP